MSMSELPARPACPAGDVPGPPWFCSDIHAGIAWESIRLFPDKPWGALTAAGRSAPGAAVAGGCTFRIHSGTASGCTRLDAAMFLWGDADWPSRIQGGRACSSINEFADIPLVNAGPPVLDAGVAAACRRGVWSAEIYSALSGCIQLGKASLSMESSVE